MKSNDELADQLIAENYIGQIPQINGCARCRGNHVDIAAFTLSGDPVGTANAWCICPETGNPIMITFIPDKISQNE